MSTVREFMGWAPKLMPTGVTRVDDLLGGGLPIGVTLISGSRPQIAAARRMMALEPDDGSSPGRTLYHLPSLPARIEDLPAVVRDRAHLYGRGEFPTIIDTGDLTGKYPGSSAHIGNVLRDLRAVAVVSKAAVLVELLPSKHEWAEVRRAADLTLHVDSEGVWRVTSTQTPLPLASLTPSQAWRLKPPATPERVINALRKNPGLAWEVARSLQLLGPWQRSITGGWERLTPEGVCGAMVGVTVADDRTEHIFFRHQGEEKRVPLMSRTTDEVLTEADEVLQQHGFLFIDEVPSW